MKAFFRKMLHFGKIPKKFGLNLAKFGNILANFAKFAKICKKNQQKFQQFLTKN
jgi:hypothetical protein